MQRELGYEEEEEVAATERSRKKRSLLGAECCPAGASASTARHDVSELWSLKFKDPAELRSVLLQKAASCTRRLGHVVFVDWGLDWEKIGGRRDRSPSVLDLAPFEGLSGVACGVTAPRRLHLISSALRSHRKSLEPCFTQLPDAADAVRASRDAAQLLSALSQERKTPKTRWRPRAAVPPPPTARLRGRVCGPEAADEGRSGRGWRGGRPGPGGLQSQAGGAQPRHSLFEGTESPIPFCRFFQKPFAASEVEAPRCKRILKASESFAC